MWANILTKPLQGSKFRTMRAFLMNCPLDYSEDPIFTTQAVFQPISNNIPMKPRVPKTATSLRECVRAKPSGTKVPSTNLKLIPVPFAPNMKSISWHDALLADHPTSTPSPRGSVMHIFKNPFFFEIVCLPKLKKLDFEIVCLGAHFLK